MTAAVAAPYDPFHPIARGVTLVEASAGTGKTFNIAHLVLRLVAERGVPIERVLVVTFTRAATAELRDRVRRRLADALRALTGPTPDPDPLLAELRRRADEAALAVGDDFTRRVREALEAFDEAFITTIHGFCQRMLAQNAFESDADFGLELVQDPGPVLEEIVDDFLTRERYAVDADTYAFLIDSCGFTRESLLDLAARAVDDPEVTALPAPDAHDLAHGAALAAAARAAHPHLADDLVAAVDAARAAGVFKKTQRTYDAKKAREPAQALAAWRDAGPNPALVPPPSAAVAYFFDLSAMRDRLADPERPFTHPALEALRPLVALRGLAAASRRAAFVAHARAAFDAANAARRVQTYQDLLRGLARRLDAPADDPRRAALVAAVGARFDAALIDEFQDTDPLQWTLFRTLFGAGGHVLYLIGDPKQAIYGFRGANVHVYLDAKTHAASLATMARNYRSDAGLVDALNHLMHRDGFFAVAGIPYAPVDTPPRAPLARLRPAPGASPEARAPLQLRFFGAEALKIFGKGDAGRLIPPRVAADVVALLASDARLHDPAAPDADAEGFRPLRPGDCAVLVRKGRQADAIARALRARGVPAVRSGADSVLASEEAHHLALWLEACAAGGRDAPARAAALTPLFGETLETLRRVDDEEPAALARWDAWLAALARWGRALDAQGLMATVRAMMVERAVAERLLRWPDGERRLTNLRHLVELLHAAEHDERLGLSGLIAWLARQREAPTLDREALELRLERDDEAVQVVTMHAAKGLEYPVVFAPYLWDGRLLFGRDAERLIVPDPRDPTARLLDLHLDSAAPPKDAHLRAAEREAQRENLRLFYVALTRAELRLYLYVGAVRELATSPAAAALYGDAGPAPLAADPEAGGADRLARARAFVEGASPSALLAPLDALVATAPVDASGAPVVAVTLCEPASAARHVARAVAPPPPLLLRVFARRGLDRLWRRHSYSALTRGLEAAAAAAPSARAPLPEPLADPAREAFDADDVVPSPHALVRARDPLPPLPPAAAVAPPVPLADFPGGTEAGLFLHEVFEHLDFTALAPDADPALGRAHLDAVLDDRLAHHGFDAPRWRETLAAGFTAAVRAPLGGPLGAARLADIPRADRLDELAFDLPLAGGLAHGTAAHPRPIDGRDLARAIALRPGDAAVRQGYLDALAELPFGPLAGFLTGSIDLTFRRDGRWYVVDYKSNRVAPERGLPLTVHHFTPERVRWEMEEHHYYLQYHLYALALHRYLRWRIGPSYSYESRMGGVYYLFVRGLTVAAPPAPGASPPGVFYDLPPFAVIDALDRLFADAAPAGGLP